MTTNCSTKRAKKNILFSYKICGEGGGAEKNIIEVSEHIAKQHNVVFLLAGGYIDPRLAAVGKIYLFPSRGRLLLFPLDLFYMAYVIWRESIDLIHAHHRYPAFLASLLRHFLHTKLLTTVHNKFPDKGKISLWGDRAIAVSQGVADWLVHECGMAPDKVNTVHNGIKPPRVHTTRELEETKVEFGAPPAAVVLCSVGRLTKQKNYPNLLHALTLLASKNWFLLLVGDGEDKSMLVEMTVQTGTAGKIRFLGIRRDVDRIMQVSDLFVLSSAWEGFPYVIIEALANGLPIVCTDVGGNSEGVIDGVTGYLVPSEDPVALARRIDILIGDAALRKKFSDSGRKLFHERFLDDSMLSRVDEIYEAMFSSN